MAVAPYLHACARGIKPNLLFAVVPWPWCDSTHKSLAGFSAVGRVCPSVCLSAVWTVVGQVDYFTTANTGLFICLYHVYLLEVVFVSSLVSMYYFVSVVMLKV